MWPHLINISFVSAHVHWLLLHIFEDCVVLSLWQLNVGNGKSHGQMFQPLQYLCPSLDSLWCAGAQIWTHAAGVASPVLRRGRISPAVSAGSIPSAAQALLASFAAWPLCWLVFSLAPPWPPAPSLPSCFQPQPVLSLLHPWSRSLHFPLLPLLNFRPLLAHFSFQLKPCWRVARAASTSMSLPSDESQVKLMGAHSTPAARSFNKLIEQYWHQYWSLRDGGWTCMCPCSRKIHGASQWQLLLTVAAPGAQTQQFWDIRSFWDVNGERIGLHLLRDNSFNPSQFMESQNTSESQNHLGWKRAPRSLSPTFN